MQRLTQITDVQTYRQALAGSVGFVPTMGALHEGHASLVRQSVNDNSHTLVSIFVNPTQFDQSTDLAAYPNTLETDLNTLEMLGVDAVFLPDFNSMYPDDYAYQLSEDRLSRKYCGAHRPGHFDGVLSVVMKLFNITQPDKAYFGEKDHQQLTLIKGLVEAFFVPVEVVSCPIVREPDGLAMSSRNLRLSAAQRKLAPMLYQVLSQATSLTAKHQRLEKLGFDVDYLEVMGNRLLAAASLGEIRLIDNVPYQPGGGA
ncbi:pantoate--beta-alanine ligase [Marinicella sediminis]|uniref:Pantothenate synthetase n=1 Tax=Marinicella sediminis TaxID=1792834 RepID=A0ABV7J958_9GAMM|nr:pantoate--beta-alanine ligase [Marinicella sediminis]